MLCLFIHLPNAVVTLEDAGNGQHLVEEVKTTNPCSAGDLLNDEQLVVNVAESGFAFTLHLRRWEILGLELVCFIVRYMI